jgi:hypothetical protein
LFSTHDARFPGIDFDAGSARAGENKAVTYDILFAASAETMVAIATDSRHPGAGITSLLDGARR